MQIDRFSNWYNAIESVLVYKNVTGDFDVHTTLYAARTSNPAQQAEPEYRLGGLLARNPASSAFSFYSIPDTEGELRLTRVGSDFSMYYRPIGDLSWQFLDIHTRADLPATLQVGMMAYDFNGSPDLMVSFDEVVFE